MTAADLSPDAAKILGSAESVEVVRSLLIELNDLRAADVRNDSKSELAFNRIRALEETAQSQIETVARVDNINITLGQYIKLWQEIASRIEVFIQVRERGDDRTRRDLDELRLAAYPALRRELLEKIDLIDVESKENDHALRTEIQVILESAVRELRAMIQIANDAMINHQQQHTQQREASQRDEKEITIARITRGQAIALGLLVLAGNVIAGVLAYLAARGGP